MSVLVSPGIQVLVEDAVSNDYRCGYGLFNTGSGDPFLGSCVVHDLHYEMHESGLGAPNVSRADIDDQFLDNMLRQAGSSFALKIRAYLYYSVVRIVGGFAW